MRGRIDTRRDYLGILNLLVSSAATEREIKVKYRRLARIYHPDKYDPTTNKMSKIEAQNILNWSTPRTNTFARLKKYIYSIYVELAGSKFWVIQMIIIIIIIIICYNWNSNVDY